MVTWRSIHEISQMPSLADVLAPRFALWRASSGAAEPGIWVAIVQIDEREIDVKIDLIVPEGIAPPGGTRGARPGPHG